MREKRHDNNSFKIKDMTEVQKDICEKVNIYLLKRDRDTSMNSLKKEIKELTRRTKEIKEDIDKLDQYFCAIDTMEPNKIKNMTEVQKDTLMNSLKKEIKELTRRTKEIKQDIDKLDQYFHETDIIKLNKKEE